MLNKEAEYTTGSPELDDLIGPILPNSMLLIAGHPGSGKTSLASQICYANTRLGKKCLYVTFYEDKGKLYKNMSKIGVDFQSAEEKGFFKFVKLPVVSIESFLKEFASLVEREDFDVVVLDSVNPVLELTEKREEHRAILLNFFYQLTSSIIGLLVVLAEVEARGENVETRPLDFVADAVIYLKHRVERGMLSRIMELRKIRGLPLQTVEIPFVIIEGKGIRVFKPPKPGEICPGPVKKLSTTIKEFLEGLGGSLKTGDTLLVSYPPWGRTPLTLLPLVDLAITNDSKILFVTFLYSPDVIEELLTGIMQDYLNFEAELAREVLKKYLHIASFNPSAYSPSHLMMLLADLIESVNPEIVVFHGGEVLAATYKGFSDFWINHRNLMVWLKNKGKIVVNYLARIDPYWNKILEAVSDLVVRVYFKREGNGELHPEFLVWRQGFHPQVIGFKSEHIGKLASYSRELAKLAKQRLGEGGGRER